VHACDLLPVRTDRGTVSLDGVSSTRRRSLLVGLLLGLAATLVGVAVLRATGDDDRADAQLTEPGGTQIPGIATQGDVTGHRLPDAVFARLDGGKFRFADLAGTPLVVNLWASWCGPCVAEMPDFQAVYERVGDRVEFVGVNHSDNEDAARELADRTGVKYPLVRDPTGSVAATLEAARMPTTFFVGADGRVVDVHPGELSAAELATKIDELFPP